MVRTYYAPYGTEAETFAEPAGGNTGTRSLGHYLVLPDNRKYRYALNDGTAEVAGNLYQSVVTLVAHRDMAISVAYAIGAVSVAVSAGSVAIGEDIYNEGQLHTNDDTGEGYTYRIKRARAVAGGNASGAVSTFVVMNFESGVSIQVALTTATTVSLSRNRFHAVLIHPSPPTSRLAGVSPGVAAANRYYWSQIAGEAAVLADGTLLQGKEVMASITVDGAVENYKRRVTLGGTSISISPNYGLLDQDGASIAIGFVNGATATSYDITGGISVNAPKVGVCIHPNISTEYGLVDLTMLGG